MSQVMDVLRGPALGVILMIFLLAGVVLITAFAALVAQFGLFLRWRPQTVPGRETDSAARVDTGEQILKERNRPSAQVAQEEVPPDEIIDAEWWPEVQ